MRITNFRGEHAFLSNFYPCVFEFYGLAWKSSEHAYQALKFVSQQRVMIQQAATPGQTKRLAQKFTAEGLCNPDWHLIKVDMMKLILTQKFSIVDLAVRLLRTGDVDLIEGNTWGDTFWGCVRDGDEWLGENNLGKVLMEIRTELNEMIRMDHYAKTPDSPMSTGFFLGALGNNVEVYPPGSPEHVDFIIGKKYGQMSRGLHAGEP